MRAIVTAVLLLAGSAQALAAGVEFGSQAEQLAAMRRIQCSTADGEVVTWYWNGYMYSRVPGEPDRQLFAVEGMNIRRCGPLDGATDGSFKMVTREVLLYKDPRTGEVLDEWQNPWTGKTVRVLHIANDPVNQRITATDRSGRPFELKVDSSGGRWWLTSTVPLFYRNALGGDYQDYIGGKYHATEMFNFFGNVKDLNAPRVKSAPVEVAWVRHSDWLPWMEMGGRAGLVYFNTAGRKLDSFDQLSATLRREIAENYPAYAEPPPLDDARPNETSWTYFRKMVPPPK